MSTLQAYNSEQFIENASARAQSRGFRMVKGNMMTYEQDKLGLFAYCDERRVLDDRVHTTSIDSAGGISVSKVTRPNPRKNYKTKTCIHCPKGSRPNP